MNHDRATTILYASAIVIIIKVFAEFGILGLLVTVASILLVWSALFALDRFTERMRLRAPCKHGIAGALRSPEQCELCRQEKMSEEHEAKERAAAEEARRKAEEGRRYQEWVRRIRLPSYLIDMPPEDFERLVCALFQKMGFSVEETSYSGDGGVDGYLRKDADLSILQCKRVKGSVGAPVLRDLFGTMHGSGAKEGIVATTGTVSKQARSWAEGKPIRIIELDELVSLLRTHFAEDDVIPSDFTLHNDGSHCPRCGHALRLINGKKGSFYGCTAYPKCRYTKSCALKKRRRWG